MAKKETFGKQMQLRINDEFTGLVDDWLESRGLDWSRSEAIRTLVRMGAKIDIDEHGHANEALERMSQLIKDLHSKAELDPDTIIGPELKAKFTSEFLRSLQDIDELDQRFAAFINDRSLLRNGLSDIREQILQTLVELHGAKKGKKP